MPELPEVETVARGLRAGMIGQRLQTVELGPLAMLRPSREAADWTRLEGGTVTGVDRGGKYLVVSVRTLAGDWQIMMHLGMTGQLTLRSAGAVRPTHTHAVFVFGDGRELHFRDPRRFGRLALAPAPGGEQAFAPALGVPAGAEPLTVDAAAFVAIFHDRQAPIKNALMNQKLLRGLGNIYADESLFRAGIDPRARALSAPRLRKLRRAIRAVLREAIAAGGSSISDYVASDGQPGWFHLRHRVYGKTGEPCQRCRRAIRRIVLAGRSAHFCPHCQRR